MHARDTSARMSARAPHAGRSITCTETAEIHHIPAFWRHLHCNMIQTDQVWMADLFNMPACDAAPPGTRASMTRPCSGCDRNIIPARHIMLQSYASAPEISHLRMSVRIPDAHVLVFSSHEENRWILLACAQLLTGEHSREAHRILRHQKS